MTFKRNFFEQVTSPIVASIALVLIALCQLHVADEVLVAYSVAILIIVPVLLILSIMASKTSDFHYTFSKNPMQIIITVNGKTSYIYDQSTLQTRYDSRKFYVKDFSGEEHSYFYNKKLFKFLYG